MRRSAKYSKQSLLIALLFIGPLRAGKELVNAKRTSQSINNELDVALAVARYYTLRTVK